MKNITRRFVQTVVTVVAANTIVATVPYATDRNALVLIVTHTGQTTMYLAGDDGDVEAGRAWPAVRFTAHGDGTITDHITGLMWQQDPDESGKTWDVAFADANGATITGYTDWRLPNVRELITLVYFGEPEGAGRLNSVGFSDVPASNPLIWSSTREPHTAPATWDY